jgi:hypothetical protein
VIEVLSVKRSSTHVNFNFIAALSLFLWLFISFLISDVDLDRFWNIRLNMTLDVLRVESDEGGGGCEV